MVARGWGQGTEGSGGERTDYKGTRELGEVMETAYLLIVMAVIQLHIFANIHRTVCLEKDEFYWMHIIPQ